MPPYSQSSLYDTAGIPIAVDPRIPRPTHTTTSNLDKPTSTPSPSIQSQGQVANATNSSKRTAHDDIQGDFYKRVKSDQVPSPTLDSPVQITAPPPTPVTAKPARATAGDFMAECAANGIILDITPSTSDPNPTSSSTTTSTTPPVPIDAIAILQDASAAMLKALVKKDAPNRENQLLVAVGTLRTCLDVHFVPHIDAWRLNAMAYKASPPVGVVALPIIEKTSLSITIPEVPAPSLTGSRKVESAGPPPLGIPSTREALRNQLANARATMYKQQQDLKHRDDEIARSKEENKRLNARLDQMTAQAQAKPCKPTAPMMVVNKTIKEQTEKLNNQRIQLNNFQTQNARLKDLLKSAGIPDGEGGAGRSERLSSGDHKSKKGNQVSDWKEIWWTKGRSQTPRLAQSIGTDSASTSGTSSGMATPMIGPQTLTSIESSKKSSNGSQSGSRYQDDPRSHWERTVAEKEIGLPSPKRDNSSIPTGPRSGWSKMTRQSPAPSPSYLSENGWGDYYSPDGFGTMQADRLDYA